MKHIGSPFAWWQAGWRAGWMMAEANMVISMRIMGMSGMARLPKDETLRMALEKPPAFLRAGVAWQRAWLRGASWPAQSLAFTGPLSRKAASNRKRLSRG